MNGIAQMLLLFVQLLQRILRLPLERRKRLRNEAGGAQRNRHALALRLIGIPIEGINHLLTQIGDTFHVLQGLGRQTQHKVQLHGSPATLKRFGHRFEDFLLAQILIDSIAQTLRTRLGSKGQTGTTQHIETISQLLGEAVDTQGRQRNIGVFLLCPIQQGIQQFFQLGVVAGRQRGQRKLLVAGATAEVVTLLIDGFHRLFTHRTIDETGLAEAATTDTTTEDLRLRTIKHNVRKRNNEAIGIVGSVQVLNNALANGGFDTVQRRHRRYSTVLVIAHVIQGRNINTLDVGAGTQELFLGVTLSLIFLIQVNDLQVHLFALAEEENVEKVRQRLRIAGTGTTGHHQRIALITVSGAQRHAGQLQHVQNGGEAHLVLQGKADKIKITDGIVTLQTKQRDMILQHQRFHILVGSKYALAPHVGLIVKLTVENLHAQVGHTYLIQIRETKSKTHSDIFFILHHAVQFATGITRWLLHLQKQAFQLFFHDGTPYIYTQNG